MSAGQKTYRYYTDDEKKAALDSLEKGMSLKEVAEITGCTDSAIYLWRLSDRAKRGGYQALGTPRWGDQTRESALGLVRMGVPDRDVTAKLGVPLATVGRWRRDAKIPPGKATRLAEPLPQQVIEPTAPTAPTAPTTSATSAVPQPGPTEVTKVDWTIEQIAEAIAQLALERNDLKSRNLFLEQERSRLLEERERLTKELGASAQRAKAAEDKLLRKISLDIDLEQSRLSQESRGLSRS